MSSSTTYSQQALCSGFAIWTAKEPLTLSRSLRLINRWPNQIAAMEDTGDDKPEGRRDAQPVEEQGAVDISCFRPRLTPSARDQVPEGYQPPCGIVSQRKAEHRANQWGREQRKSSPHDAETLPHQELNKDLTKAFLARERRWQRLCTVFSFCFCALLIVCWCLIFAIFAAVIFRPADNPILQGIHINLRTNDAVNARLLSFDFVSPMLNFSLSIANLTGRPDG